MVSDVIELACVKRGWTMASRGMDVPARVVHPSLLYQLDHTRPDLVLIGKSTKEELEVVLVEVTVAFETDKNLIAANTRKQKVYQPLMKAIKMTHHSRRVGVEVAVVVVGTRGVVPSFWFENLAPLKFTVRELRTLAKQASTAALKGSQWIWGLWAAQAHGGEIAEQSGYH